MNTAESDLTAFYSSIGLCGWLYDRQLNEARFGLSRLLPYLPAGGRVFSILEVGAGHCLLSGYLASKGYQVSALEPLGKGFDFMTDLQSKVLTYCESRGVRFDVLHMTGEELALRDRFDLAFTINAIEHMRDPLTVVDNMHASLKPGGTMLLHAPNYNVPFEPHFNFVLVTRSKRLNGWLYRSRIIYPEVWDELNLIRFTDLRRHFRRNGVSFHFNRNAMRDMASRVIDDQVFGLRRTSLQRAFCSVLKYTGLISLMRLLPGRLQSPMEIVVTKAGLLSGVGH